MSDDVRATVKEFILREFLPGEDPAELTDATPLITGGVLDSIATLKLVMFLEETYGVVVSDEEMVPENLDSLDNIAAYVRRKRAA